MSGEKKWKDIGYGVQIGEIWCVGSTNSLLFYEFVWSVILWSMCLRLIATTYYYQSINTIISLGKILRKK